MKKKIILRGLLGFPIGIAIGYIITIIISMIWAQGYYAAATPELMKMMGNEINAVIVQAFLCGVIGASCAMATFIWEIDKWSIVKQSGIYFAIISAAMLPIAYFTNWMQHSLSGFFSYFGIFAGIYIIVWLFQYLGWKAKVKKINEKLRKDRF